MCIIGEELSAVCHSTSATVLHQAVMVVDSLVRNGTEDQQDRYLPRLCDGTWVSCLAITEPGSGSDALSMRTSAKRVDGGWLINGSKTFITNGPNCDMTMVYAKTGPIESREMGLFIVEATADGFSRGKKMEKMGWRGSGTCELFFEDVFVPEQNLVGRCGQRAARPDEWPERRAHPDGGAGGGARARRVRGGGGARQGALAVRQADR